MLTVGSMFSGVGLLDYGLHLAGLHHSWFAERDEFRRGILAKRWPGALVLDDVRAVRADVVPRVDVIAGGFPCRGASTAGKRTGFDHPETVLWREMRRAIGDLRPRYCLIENVANLLTLARAPGEPAGSAWGEVLADLAALGFDVRWDCLPAAAFGAPHLRDRVFAIAVADPDGRGAGTGVETRRECAGWPVAAGGVEDAADATGTKGRPHTEGVPRARERHVALPEGGRGARRPRGGAWQAAPHADGVAAQPAGSERRGEPGRAAGAAGRPLGVEWGDYGPAIRRWEAVLGRPAGEPLLSGVVDGGARRVVRSRLSALGDGVQVQAGELCGRWILSHAAELARAAA